MNGEDTSSPLGTLAPKLCPKALWGTTGKHNHVNNDVNQAVHSNITAVPSYLQGLGKVGPWDTGIVSRNSSGPHQDGCTSPLHKMAEYLRISNAHPPNTLKSSLDYL